MQIYMQLHQDNTTHRWSRNLCEGSIVKTRVIALKSFTASVSNFKFSAYNFSLINYANN